MDKNLKPKDSRNLYIQWRDEIEAYEKESIDFETKGKNVVKKYKDERRARNDAASQKYNILWANVEVLQPALYAKDPIVRVARRFKQKDQVSRIAADILQKSLQYQIECTLFGDKMRAAVKDRLLPGRGTTWVRYEAQFNEVQTEDEAEPLDETLEYEKTAPDYVHWLDFGHTWARTWEEVRGVWRKTYLSRDELIKRFGDIGKDVPISDKKEDGRKSGQREVMSQRKACVYEIWDKVTKQAIWLCLEYEDGVLDALPDPLELEGFFPCPKPLFATLANDTLIPTADFVFYQDQARELDTLTERISLITSAIRVAGAYDASVPALSRILSERAENQLIPVDSWAAFAERGGLKGAVDFVPVKDLTEVLGALYEARDRAKQDMYEITGISDIVRGQTQASESATAQNLKSQYANLRLSDSQKDVARFARDTIRIMGDITASKFSRETLSQMTGIRLMTQEEKMLMQQQGMDPAQLPPEMQEALAKPSWEEVEAILRNDAIRSFRIDVETDSTIATDEQADKSAVGELFSAIGAMVNGITPAVQSGIITAEAARALVMAGLRKFELGSEVEEALEESGGQSAQMQQVQQMAQQVQQGMQQLEQAQAQFKAEQDTAAKQMQAEAKVNEAERHAAVTEIKSMHDSFTKQLEVPAAVAKEKGDMQAMAMVQQMAQQATQTAVAAIQSINQPKTVDILRDPLTMRPTQLVVTPGTPNAVQ